MDMPTPDRNLISRRQEIAGLLEEWHFDVLEARAGQDAAALYHDRLVDFILVSAALPDMELPEFCQALGAGPEDHRAHVIILTPANRRDRVSPALDAGADDCVSWPLDQTELQARLRAGQRLIAMQEDLADKSRRMTEALERANSLYASIERDLRAAARLQHSLLPEPQTRCGPLEIGVIYQPSGHVGGDLMGFFKTSAHQISTYSIDVSGHGISAALMTARLSNYFTPLHLEENIGMRRLPGGEYTARDPAAIAADLNGRLQDETDNDLYFTMLFADVNLDRGIIRFCQAGHPNPAVIRNDGSIEFPGDGGTPIGLIPDMEYMTEIIQLFPGERFLMFSDGITECTDPDGRMLENDGLAEILKRHAGLSERETLERVMAELSDFSKTETFEDDVSALMFTMPPAQA